MYACETWTLTKYLENKIQVCENNMLRRIFGPVFDQIELRWRRRHNIELRQLSKMPPVIKEIKSHRLRWAGHVQRMNQHMLPAIALRGKLEGTRPVGRPRMRWTDNIEKDFVEVMPDNGDQIDWKLLAQNRDEWNGLVRAAKGRQA